MIKLYKFCIGLILLCNLSYNINSYSLLSYHKTIKYKSLRPIVNLNNNIKQFNNNFSMKLYSKPILTLDNPVVPINRFTNIKITSLIATLVILVIYYIKVFSTNKSLKLSNSKSFFIKWLYNDIFPSIHLGIRVFLAKLTLISENTYRYINENIFQQKPIFVDTDKWNLCTLKERELLSGDYVKYRFALPNPSSILSLYAGQELFLCTVDGTDEVIKDTFYPVSSDTTKGYFDIIIKRNLQTNNNEKFINILETLAIGDELGFKEGSIRLNYRGSINNINNIVILTNGLGITPTIQILYQLLSTNFNIEIIWLNSNKNDFIFNDIIEDLELKYYEKFITYKILDNNLYNKDISKDLLVDENISSYTTGALAIICAPDFYTSNLTEYLVSKKKFPISNIVVIDTVA